MATVGSVPYVNARPLVDHFDQLGEDSPVQVLYAVPSALPEMLENGEADAILVSSIDALTVPGRRYVEGVCIGSRGPAESVRLFSKKPFEQIESVVLDQSSMTSNALAQIALTELYGLKPRLDKRPPDLHAMLKDHDAALLIGDLGMRADGAGLHVLDLGSAWTRLTGLPFVWALWTGSENLTPALAGHLQHACLNSLRELDEVIGRTIRRFGWEAGMCRRYLSETMNYRLESKDLEGLKLFGELCLRHGIVSAARIPRSQGPATAGTLA
ncbi:MAG: menaquinone biosynthesis protein [Armatimonadetes bacterium]|nr:menaquinone biosynthesis protein [Armatimonadota bacterium]